MAREAAAGDRDAEVAGFYDRLSRYFHLIHADWWDSVRRDAATVDRMIRARLPHFAEPAGTRILDCAAGIGTQSIGLHRLGYDVLACDASTEALETLQEHLAKDAEASRRPLRTQQADFRKLPETLPGERFDVVIALDNSVAHMLTNADLEAALASMGAMAKPGGLVLVALRPYDQLLEERPLVMPPQPSVTPERISYQIWRWSGTDLLTPHLFLILPDDRVLTWHTTLRAIRLREVTDTWKRLGWRAEALQPEQSGHFQPLVVASKA
ncbi:MAG TPA: class I SAM-dependent methyltransferase [Kiloniellales bacterium]|nr:class I SAM-dependent methyltransferase [Kiloniellales bacterium]